MFSLQVQEFSKSITQDSPYHLQDKRLVTNFMQFLKSFLGNLTWVNTNGFIAPCLLYIGGSGNVLLKIKAAILSSSLA